MLLLLLPERINNKLALDAPRRGLDARAVGGRHRGRRNIEIALSVWARHVAVVGRADRRRPLHAPAKAGDGGRAAVDYDELTGSARKRNAREGRHGLELHLFPLPF